MPPKRKSAGRPPKAKADKAVENGTSKRIKVSHHTHCSKPGVVLTFGEGDVGQLGHGDEMLQRLKPRLVADVPDDCVSVVAGGMHTVCLTSTGEVYTFGCNDEGALGRHITDDETEPYLPGKVELGEKIVQVSAGDSHTAALTEDGRVFLWGTFRDGTGVFGLTPEVKTCKLPIHRTMDAPVVQIASGCDHLCMLTIDGDLYTMGCGEQGQLGRVAEIFAVRGGRKGPVVLLEPNKVNCKKVKGKRVLFDSVWCSAYCTFAKTRDGTVLGWGLNNYHHLGLRNLQPHYMPAVIESFSNINPSSIAGGQHHTVLLNNEGKVYSLGRTDYGRLGLGEKCTESNEPALVASDLADSHVISIACGSTVSLACTSNGEAYAWGMGTSFQLGTGSEDDAHTPTLLQGKQLENRRVIGIGAGGQHTVLLAVDN